MILKLFPFRNDIVLSEEYVTVFQINNKALFSKVANSLFALSLGQQGEENLILTDEEKRLDFEDNVLFLTDLWHFDCNSKVIISKLLNYIESNYKLDLELMDNFQKQVHLIQIGIRDITDELPFDIEMKSVVTLQDILKMLGVKVAKPDGYTLIERALTIIEIVEVFKLYPIIIFCNIKNYFKESELDELYKQALHCKIKIMMLEVGPTNPLITNEKVWYIDEDYEEFIS